MAVLLVLCKELWLELNVSRLVDTVDVTEGGRDGEGGGDGEESLVDLEDVFRLGVKRGVVDTYVEGGSVRRWTGEGRRCGDVPVLSTPSSSPPVIPISISSQRSILAMRLKYLAQVAMFSSLDSSERSSMCDLHEPKSG